MSKTYGRNRPELMKFRGIPEAGFLHRFRTPFPAISSYFPHIPVAGSGLKKRLGYPRRFPITELSTVHGGQYMGRIPKFSSRKRQSQRGKWILDFGDFQSAADFLEFLKFCRLWNFWRISSIFLNSDFFDFSRMLRTF